MRCALAVGLAVAAAACDWPPVDAGEPRTSAAQTADESAAEGAGMIEPMTGFGWVVPDALAAMPRPGARRPLADDLAFLRSEGIDVVVSLTEEPLDADALAAAGVESVHLPVRDFTPPTLAQMQAFAAHLDEWAAAGRRAGVHCTAGLGRSGTMVAAAMVHRGMTAAQAIAEVRRLRPGSIETAAQERAVAAFERLIRRDRMPSSLDQ